MKLPDELMVKIPQYYLRSYATPYGIITFRWHKDSTRYHTMLLASVDKQLRVPSNKMCHIVPPYTRRYDESDCDTTEQTSQELAVC